MDTNKFTISSSPHVRDKDTVQSVMGDVLIAMVPAAIAGIKFFGMGAAINIIAGVAGAVIAEVLMQKMMKRPVTVGDLSAVVTGVLLAFNVPPTAPWWMTFVGGLFAIAVGKQLFGGLGHNYINPALVARAMLLASWPVLMTNWAMPIGSQPAGDAVSAATPLAFIKGAELGAEKYDVMSMFIGNIPGTIGETCKIALILGGIYLVYRGVIDLLIPCLYILTVFVLTFCMSGFDPSMAVYNVLGGGLMLGAIFMATDYTTSPMYKKGKVIYAIGCGVLTSVIRYYGGYPEGVSYSILLMNVATPLIDKYLRPRKFGEVAKNAR